MTSGASNPSPMLPAHLATAAQRIDNSLNHNSANPIALSHNAKIELEALHAEYLGDLGQEAVRLARRERLSTVDKMHVVRAAERLSSDPMSTANISNITNSIGGLLAGAGLAGIYQIVFVSEKHSSLEIAVAAVLAILGFMLLSVGMTAMLIRKRG